MGDDTLLRVVLVAVVVGAAVVAGRVWTRRSAPRHQPVDLSGLGLPAGVVLFTSTDCGNCAEARRRVEELDVPVREVTWELEADTFRRAGVDAVPLVAFLDAAGRTVTQVAGIPSRAALRSGLVALGR